MQNFKNPNSFAYVIHTHTLEKPEEGSRMQFAPRKSLRGYEATNTEPGGKQGGQTACSRIRRKGSRNPAVTEGRKAMSSRTTVTESEPRLIASANIRTALPPFGGGGIAEKGLVAGRRAIV